MNPPTVVLMLKAPHPGRVKTRLAAGIGAEAACVAYRRLVKHQLASIPAGWRIAVHHDPPEAGPLMSHWLGEGIDYVPQAPGDLGARLRHAMNAHANALPLIFIGGDCPYLDEKVFHEVAAALMQYDVVLVPAVDGGYVLLAMNKPHPELFENVAWSTEHVLEQTRQRAREAGLVVALLPPLEDVDDAASWGRAEARLREK